MPFSYSAQDLLDKIEATFAKIELEEDEAVKRIYYQKLVR
jgi:hypothetical protein